MCALKGSLSKSKNKKYVTFCQVHTHCVCVCVHFYTCHFDNDKLLIFTLTEDFQACVYAYKKVITGVFTFFLVIFSPRANRSSSVSKMFVTKFASKFVY